MKLERESYKMTGNRVSLAATLVLWFAPMGLVASADEIEYLANKLEPLCEDKTTNLTMRSEFISLLNQASDLVASGKCSKRIYEALQDLNQLLGRKSDVVCTMNKAERIKHYYLKYLDTSTKESGKRERLPKSLRHFVLGYGMQVSNLCKSNMVQTFQGSRANELIGDWRIDPNDLLLSDSGLSMFMKARRRPENILLPSHLGTMLPSGVELRKQLSMKMQDDRYALRKKAICERRYRPIYKQNILPFAVLASIGFDYKDELIRKFVNPDNMKYWSRMVFVCELIRAIEVKDESGSATDKKVDIPVVEELFYDEFRVGNMVYDRTNAKLVDAVESFQTNLSEAQRAEEFVFKSYGPWQFIDKLKTTLKKKVKDQVKPIPGRLRRKLSS